MVRGGGFDEARRLLAVDCLLEMAAKEGVLHVQLVNRPGTGSGDAKDGSDRYRFDNRAERLVIVDAVSLGEAADHPTRLMTSKRPIEVELMFEDPIARHNIGARGAAE